MSTQLFDPLRRLSRGYQGFCLEVKQLGCDVDRSPLSSINEWSYSYICLHGVDRATVLYMSYFALKYNFISYLISSVQFHDVPL